MRFTPIFGVVGLAATAAVVLAANVIQPPVSDGVKVSVTPTRQGEIVSAIRQNGYRCDSLLETRMLKSNGDSNELVARCDGDLRYQVTARADAISSVAAWD